ncbi:MAG: hypothetical protein JXB46_10805 [Candidatus Eisenbacteria bacterium]|nr:hypothetical protein [Candidatus Eisenbacteria bacterium]
MHKVPFRLSVFAWVSVLLSTAPLAAAAQETRSYLAPLDYYVPGFEETGLAFNVIRNLPAAQPATLRRALEAYWADDGMPGLFLRAYVYRVESEASRATVIGFLSEKAIEGPAARALRMRYASEKETVPAGGDTRARYNYQGRYFDEDIDLSGLQDMVPYDRLYVRTFACRWGYLVLTDMAGQTTGVRPNAMMAGGDTNALSVVFQRSEGIELQGFQDKVDALVRGHERVYDVTQLGVFREAGFDRIVVLLEPADAEFHVTTHYYRADARTMFSVTYSVYFSAVSMTYEMRHDVFKQVMLVSTLVYYE